MLAHLVVCALAFETFATLKEVSDCACCDCHLVVIYSLLGILCPQLLHTVIGHFLPTKNKMPWGIDSHLYVTKFREKRQRSS